MVYILCLLGVNNLEVIRFRAFTSSVFIQTLLMFSNSLKMIKIGRNMSELWQIVCKKYNFNISFIV